MNTRRGRFYKWASRQECHHRRTHRLHWQYELLEQSWSAEEIHRIDSPDCAQTCLNSIQARHIRFATRRENSSPRTCPKCGSPLQVVNQRDLLEWEHQPLKIGCTTRAAPVIFAPSTSEHLSPRSHAGRLTGKRNTGLRNAEKARSGCVRNTWYRQSPRSGLVELIALCTRQLHRL